MFSLTYVSSAARLLQECELDSALCDIYPTTVECGISGMLLYSAGNVMETLEGPENLVRERFSRIELDPRHHGLIVILKEYVDHRAFDGWSMGYPKKERYVTPEGFTPFLDTPVFDTSRLNSAQRLQTSFVRNCR